MCVSLQSWSSFLNTQHKWAVLVWKDNKVETWGWGLCFLTEICFRDAMNQNPVRKPTWPCLYIFHNTINCDVSAGEVYLSRWRIPEVGCRHVLTFPSPIWKLHRCFLSVRKTSPPPPLPPRDQWNMESSLCWGKMLTEELFYGSAQFRVLAHSRSVSS